MQLPLAYNPLTLMKVSIPQAVGAVATTMENEKGLDVEFVSIPQAVGAVATQLKKMRACQNA